MESENCAPARRLKQSLVNCSAEPLGAHCGEEMTNERNKERSMFGHVQTKKHKNELGKMRFCSNLDKIVDRETGITF